MRTIGKNLVLTTTLLGGLYAGTASAFVGLGGSWNSITPDCTGAGEKLHCRVTGVLTAANPGDEQAPRTVLRFFLSQGTTLDTGDLLLKERRLTALGPGENKELPVRLKLPKGRAGAGLFVTAHFDADNEVAEINEDNNLLASPPIPE